MLKFLSLVLPVLISIAAQAAEPGRTLQRQFSSSPARVLCKDDFYQCMYNCVVSDGTICTPTPASDRNCPTHTVTNSHWITQQVVVLDFAGSGDMACRVISRAKTNAHCGMTKFGWDCSVKAGRYR